MNAIYDTVATRRKEACKRQAEPKITGLRCLRRVENKGSEREDSPIEDLVTVVAESLVFALQGAVASRTKRIGAELWAERIAVNRSRQAARHLALHYAKSASLTH